MTGEILRCLVHATAVGLVAALILAVDPGPDHLRPINSERGARTNGSRPLQIPGKH
jgi:hypothetical protein